ncbi:MAG TPA: hypothetical protein VMZ51_05515 [Acidimicrobiales bacterium]|nr:hypothetical protein [Acidimicrobiales bacterium]
MGTSRRKALLSGAITAGVFLAPATATLAAGAPAQSNAGGSETGQEHASQGQATAAADAAPAGAGNGNGNAGQDNAAGGLATAGENRPEAAGNAGTGGGATAAAPGTRPGPPGNNGTIKVDGVDFDSHPNNEPHVDCIFEIDFYGFDASQPVTVSFALQSPTTGGTITGTAPSGTTLDGDDNSFGGSERGLDGSLRYTLGFSGVSPHPKQGYHVKLTVHAPGAKGADTKHKVFWVEPCGTPPAVVPVDTTTSTSTTTTSSTSTSTSTSTTTTTTTTTTLPPGGTQQVQNQGSATTPGRLAVLGEVIERSPAVAVAPLAAGVNAGSARVLGISVERGDLARTGLDVFQLVTLGALALLGGVAAVRVSRRQTPATPRFPI